MRIQELQASCKKKFLKLLTCTRRQYALVKEHSDRLPGYIARIYGYQRYLSPINMPSSIISRALACLRISHEIWMR